MAGPAGLIGWLESTAWSLAMRENAWLYPTVEIFHTVGFVMLAGAVAMFDLRVLGFSRFLPIQALGRHLLRRAVAGFALAAPAGLTMFAAHPHDLLDNRVFLVKLALIAAAGINAALFHVGVYRHVAAWDTDKPAPGLARMQAFLSLALIAAICCGRLLAYP